MKSSSVVTYVKILTIGTALFCKFHVSAQSSLLGTLPMQFNPAFAGAAGSHRVGLSSHLITYKSPFTTDPTLRYNKQNYAFSVDNFIPKLNSGIGIHGGYTRLALNEWRTTEPENMHDMNLGLSIAPKFSFKGKYTLSPAVEINVKFKTTNYDHFSQKLERVKTSLQPEIRLGLAFNTRKFYMGIAYHINGTLGYERGGRASSMDGDVYKSTGPRWYVQIGYNFQRRDDSKFSFSPQIVYGCYKSHVNYGNRDFTSVNKEMILNLNFRYKQIIWGVAYDQAYEGLKLMVGWQKKNFRVAYIHGGGFTSGYNGQISLRYIFNSKKTSDLNRNISY